MFNHSKETEQIQILIFSLDEPRYALNISSVERVVRAVDTIPLPNAPPLVIGVINMYGQIIPVVDIRPCFRMPHREINQNDRFILARTSTRLLVLVADSIAGIYELTQKELVSAEQVLPGVAYIKSLAKLDGDLVLLCDLDQFLTCEDEQKLQEALSGCINKTGSRAQSAFKEVV